MSHRYWRIRRSVVGLLLLIVLVAYPWVPSYLSETSPVAATNQYACPPGGNNDPDLQPRPSKPPVLKTIDLTDEGELVNRCEWTDALYELSKVDQAEVVLLYVHGWKHNAEKGDTDLEAFRDQIAHFSKRERQSLRPRHVVGIYIGWHGLSTSLPIVREFTFWGRKRAADRISQSAVVTKLVGAIANIRRLKGYQEDLIVLLGHSFGARVRFTATSQLLLYEVQMAHPGKVGGTYGILRGPADAIILVNPAFEASVYTAMDALRRDKEQFAASQHPLLVTISTDNDWATRVAFPLGQWAGFVRKERQRTTLGNYEKYFTHSLLPEGKDSTSVNNVSLPWYDSFCDGGICLKRRERDLQPNNPFIVATTTGDVLDGHNGLWSARFADWIARFIESLDQRLNLSARPTVRAGPSPAEGRSDSAASR